MSEVEGVEAQNIKYNIKINHTELVYKVHIFMTKCKIEGTL